MTIYDIDPTLPKGWMGDWEELKRQGSVTHETMHRTKDGMDIPVEVSANYVEHDGKEYNFVFARDISDAQEDGGAAAPDPDLGGPRRRPDLLGQPGGPASSSSTTPPASSWATRAKSCWA